MRYFVYCSDISPSPTEREMIAETMRKMVEEARGSEGKKCKTGEKRVGCASTAAGKLR